MFPSPEILGFRINWFELITVLSILFTLVFGRCFFYSYSQKTNIKSFLLPLLSLLVIGYFFTFLLAYLEGLTYAIIKNDTSFYHPFGTHKKFLGFIVLVFLVSFLNSKILKSKSLYKLGDFLAIVICFFIMLEANACLFDGHGCYGKFTNLPWGMHFLHGSAPTLFPVHPTPIYITISHALLLVFLFTLYKKGKLTGKLILLLFIGTSISNVAIEFVKDTTPLFLQLNFSQIVYSVIAIISIYLITKNNKQQLNSNA